MVVAASKHKGKQKGKWKKGTLKPMKGIQKKTRPKRPRSPKVSAFNVVRKDIGSGISKSTWTY